MTRLFAPAIGRARSIPIACCAVAGLAITFLPARAAVEVRGTTGSVHVVAHNAKVSEVLRALTETLKSFNWREMTNLDGVISGSYKGSLEDVLHRILRGYNYVVTTQETAIDIVVIGRSDGAPTAVAPVPGAVAPVSTVPAPGTVAPVPAAVTPLPRTVPPVLPMLPRNLNPTVTRPSTVQAEQRP